MCLMKNVSRDIAFIKLSKRRFDEDNQGRRIFRTQEDKNVFDEDEKLNMAELFNKYKDSSKINNGYLCERGLMQIGGFLASGHNDVMPTYEFKDIKEIDWLKKHLPRESILFDNCEKIEFTFHLPPKYKNMDNSK